MYNYLDFEKPVADLEGKIVELKKLAENGEAVDVAEEIARLEKRSKDALRDVYKALTPWQKVQVARHPDRPHCLDYVERLFTDFTPLAGDRAFGEDHAIVGGFGRFRGQPIAVLGQEKGSDTKSRLKHNFGSPRPGRLPQGGARHGTCRPLRIPLLTLVDTAGAYPGRRRGGTRPGRSDRPLDLGVPGAQGAVGLCGHRRRRFGRRHRHRHGQPRHMLEHAIYSVISPEGAASILWRDTTRSKDAATIMKITAQDLLDLKSSTRIIPEPLGGAHRAPDAVIAATGDPIAKTLKEFAGFQHGLPRAPPRKISGDRPQP